MMPVERFGRAAQVPIVKHDKVLHFWVPRQPVENLVRSGEEAGGRRGVSCWLEARALQLLIQELHRHLLLAPRGRDDYLGSTAPHDGCEPLHAVLLEHVGVIVPQDGVEDAIDVEEDDVRRGRNARSRGGVGHLGAVVAVNEAKAGAILTVWVHVACRSNFEIVVFLLQ